jgi:hypothetical protein
MDLRSFTWILPFALVSAGRACPYCSQKTDTLVGDTRVLGNGMIWSWIKAKNGVPEAIGVTFTETALSSLPTEKPKNGMDGYESTLSLPRNTKLLPYNHIAVDWNPKGHIPPGIYDVPHFDFHFYMMDTKQRLNITLHGADMKRCQTKPDISMMPAGFIYAPQSEVKYMGAHWVSVKAPELNGQKFTQSWIYGSYNGKVVFAEPMVTLEYLLTKPDFVADIPQPKKYPAHGLYYPTKYSIAYNPNRREYMVALFGMKKR